MAKATNFITQTAARRLRAALKRAEKRIDQLQRDREQLFSRWGGDVPGGTHIRSINLSCSDAAVIAVKTARMLGHAVVVIERNGELSFMAVNPKGR